MLKNYFPFLLALILWAPFAFPVAPVVYCIDPDIGSDSSITATSLTGDCSDMDGVTRTPYQSYSKAFSNTPTKNPGDSILFHKGKRWDITSAVSSSSLPSGALGTLVSVSGWQTASNWTECGTNKWCITMAEYPFELWIDGVQYTRAPHPKDIDATNRWSWRPTDHTAATMKLVVYATSIPSTAYSTMQYRDTSGHITYGAYGTGAKPIIDCTNQITGSATPANWTDNSATLPNTWYMTSLTTSPTNVWVNGDELSGTQVWRSEFLHNASHLSDSISATQPWYFDSFVTPKRFYYYSATNPATTFTSMYGNDKCADILDLRKDYIKLSGLELTGSNNAVLLMRGADNDIIENMGLHRGLYAIQALSNTGGDMSSNNLFRDNDLDSIVYMPISASSPESDEQTSEAIDFRTGVDHALLYRNVLANWQHDGMNFEGNTVGETTDHNMFFANEVHAAQTNDGRGFSFDCLEGNCTYNEIFFNNFHDLTQQSKFDGGPNNWTHDNFFYNAIEPPYLAAGAQGTAGYIVFISLASTHGSNGNILENNIFMDDPDPCVFLDQQSSASDTKQNHIIRNNIFLNCGTNPYIGSRALNAAIMVEKGSNIGANTYQNNLFWNEDGSIPLVMYGGTFSNGTLMSISNFNAQNGDTSNVISGNLVGDPKFVDGPGLNFHLNTGSAAIEAGLTTDRNIDYYGLTVPQTSLTDIGVSEYTATSLVWYVRPDGGTPTQCDGHSDTSYPGGGLTGLSCALSNPLYAKNMDGADRPGAFVGGDTMIISQGQYPIGYDATIVGSGTICSNAFSTDCTWNIPGGPDAIHPTRILGKGYDTATSWAGAPQLYGIGGIYRGVINLWGPTASNVEIQYLDITDHEGCQIGATIVSYACSSSTGGLWARYGIYARPGTNSAALTGPSNVLIKNVGIHGMAQGPVMSSGTSNWTYTNDVFSGNGYSGVDGDVPEYDDTADGQGGTLTITNVTDSYGGCVEAYPFNNYALRSASCVGQSPDPNPYQGFGDGWAFQGSMPDHIVIDGFTCRGNAQDCFDALHGSGTGDVKIRRALFQGNAGQAIKINQQLWLENSIDIGDCNWLHSSGNIYNDGVHGEAVITCRAGSTNFLAQHIGAVHHITGNTFYSVSDILFDLGNNTIDATSNIIFRNNIVRLGRAYMHDSSNTDPQVIDGTNVLSDFWYFYGSGYYAGFIDEDYNMIYNTKDGSGDCTGTHSLCGTDPFDTVTIKDGPFSTHGYYSSATPETNFTLSVTSQARYAVRGANTADETATCAGDCAVDYNSLSRGVNWDGGYAQYSVGSSPICGDGIKGGSEQCDGSDLNSQTCISLGYASGTLACSGSCTFNTSPCASGSNPAGTKLKILGGSFRLTGTFKFQ